MRSILVIIAVILFLSACKRKGEPVPRICTESKNSVNDIVTIQLTDTLVLVNCSERFSNQRWVMPGGGTSKDATVYFIPAGLGTFLVHLYVSDNDFVNEYEATKQVVVVP